RIRLFFPPSPGETGSGRFVDVPVDDQNCWAVALQDKMLQSFERRLNLKAERVVPSFSKPVLLDGRPGSSSSQLEYYFTAVIYIRGTNEESRLSEDTGHNVKKLRATADANKVVPKHEKAIYSDSAGDSQVADPKAPKKQRPCVEKQQEWLGLEFTRGRGFPWRSLRTTWSRSIADRRVAPEEQQRWLSLELDLLDNVYSLAEGGLRPPSERLEEVDLGAILEDIARYVERRARSPSFHADLFSGNCQEKILLSIELEGSSLPLLKMLMMVATQYNLINQCTKGHLYSVIQDLPWDFGAPACLKGNSHSA
ncbi:unnamed protein product, partial [Amoebophrya sp. A25]